MDTLIQIAAAAGPVMLAVMGVVVSLNPPNKARTHRIWAASFALVGVLSFVAIFNELRGTDQILGQIWEHIRENKPAIAPKEGARFLLNTDQINRQTKTVNITAINQGDVVARVGAAGISHVAYSDHLLTEKEEDDHYEQLKAILPPIGAGIDFMKGNGRNMVVDLKSITDAQFDNILAGKGYLYIFFIMSFRDETISENKKFLATLCQHFQDKNGNVCMGHNESRKVD